LERQALAAGLVLAARGQELFADRVLEMFDLVDQAGVARRRRAVDRRTVFGGARRIDRRVGVGVGVSVVVRVVVRVVVVVVVRVEVCVCAGAWGRVGDVLCFCVAVFLLLARTRSLGLF